LDIALNRNGFKSVNSSLYLVLTDGTVIDAGKNNDGGFNYDHGDISLTVYSNNLKLAFTTAENSTDVVGSITNSDETKTFADIIYSNSILEINYTDNSQDSFMF
jgi:hypothetical protein